LINLLPYKEYIFIHPNYFQLSTFHCTRNRRGRVAI